MTDEHNHGYTNVPRHRRRRSIYAVLLVIAVVIVAVVALSLGPGLPMHPVNPGSQASPPAGNNTSPTPSPTTATQGVTYSVTLYHLQQIALPKPV